MTPQVSALIMAVLFAVGCRTGRDVRITEPPKRSVRPEATPVGFSIVPDLIPYPDSEVSCVANAGAPCYRFRDTYYRIVDSHWFYAHMLAGPWEHVEMKYVPVEVFRVCGTVPPRSN